MTNLCGSLRTCTKCSERLRIAANWIRNFKTNRSEL